MNTLPEPIVDALKKQVPEQFKEMKTLHNRSTIKDKKLKEIEKIEEIPIFKSETIDSTYNKKPGFFEGIFAKINAIIAEDKAKKELQDVPSSKPTIQKEFPKLTNLKESASQIDKNRDISQKISPVDNIKKDLLKEYKTTKKEFYTSKIDEIAQSSRVEAPKISVESIKDIQVTSVFKSETPTHLSGGIDNQKTEMKSFKNVTLPVTDNQVKRFKTNIPIEDTQKPNFANQASNMRIKKIEVIEPIPEFKVKEVVNTPVFQAPVIVEEIPEVIVVKKAPVIPAKPIIEKNEIRDRIIITKTIAPKEEPRVLKRHIEPEDYEVQRDEQPDRMSDRVLGGGYADTEKATLKVKAYSNKKSVSAWVEVFKVGTNQRVKTFYTGKGRNINDIKLPAGVYVIKATYRTSSSKRQRSLGKVTLKEGGKINKSISFDDGRIVVFVKKNSKPLYAKIEVYKSGSKSLVSYEFSSRSKGRAEFDLAVGEYDIVVKDYNNQQVFDLVFVKGGKTRTINADF
jgi:hypothetical protein